MTTDEQLQQAIAGGQSAAATLRTFASETTDPKARKEFLKAVQILEDAIQTLKSRQLYGEQQESPYKQ